jgi:hypothetical protein
MVDPGIGQGKQRQVQRLSGQVKKQNKTKIPQATLVTGQVLGDGA